MVSSPVFTWPLAVNLTAHCLADTFFGDSGSSTTACPDR